MAKTAKRLKPKKRCCTSKPRCKRCPVRLAKKAAKAERKAAKKAKIGDPQR